MQLADTPPPQSATLGLHPVAVATIISRPAEGRRLSWTEHAVGLQLAQGCLQWTGCESNPQPLGYESDTLPTGPLHPLNR